MYRIPRFKDGRIDDFYLLSFTVNIALSAKKIVHAAANEDPGREDIEEALSIILFSLSDNQLVQCKSGILPKKSSG